MKNFDKTNFPLDHNFKEDYAYDEGGCINYYTAYSVKCVNCNLFTSHMEHDTYEENDFFHCGIANTGTVYLSIKTDFNKVYSCAEVQIKKLLE